MEDLLVPMICPACGLETVGNPVERHTDPISGKEYQLLMCLHCGTVFSRPQDPVGFEWYSRARMGEAAEQADDWRYRIFFRESWPGKQLLDIGCGAGKFLLMAQENGFHASGLDFNPQFIEKARSAGVKDVWAMGYAQFLKSCKASYDVVTLFDVLEHVPDPGNLLDGIKGLLRPGGRLVLTVPNGERPLPSPKYRERWDYPPYHFTRWTAAGLKQVLERSGFRIIQIKRSALHYGFFSGLFYYRFLYAVFPWMKRLFLGVGAQETNKTWTDLLASHREDGRGRGNLFRKMLKDPGFRQRLTDAGARIFSILLWPIEAPWVIYFRIFHPERGRTLYLAAEKM